MDTLTYALIIFGVAAIWAVIGFRVGSFFAARRSNDLILAAMTLYLEENHGTDFRRTTLTGVGQVMATRVAEVKYLATLIRAQLNETK